jgi:hypothetical protein
MSRFERIGLAFTPIRAAICLVQKKFGEDWLVFHIPPCAWELWICGLGFRNCCLLLPPKSAINRPNACLRVLGSESNELNHDLDCSI